MGKGRGELRQAAGGQIPKGLRGHGREDQVEF